MISNHSEKISSVNLLPVLSIIMVFPPFGVGEEEEKFPKVCDKCRVIMLRACIKIKSGSQVQGDIKYYKSYPYMYICKIQRACRMYKSK